MDRMSHIAACISPVETVGGDAVGGVECPCIGLGMPGLLN